jgi:phosphoribosylformylglycinamidine synthase
MVGLLDDVTRATRSTFVNEGDSIVLFGLCTDELGGSEYLARIHGVVAGRPPQCNLDAERSAIEAVLECINNGHVISAHDCSDGGLAVALAEGCVANRNALRGAEVNVDLPTGVSPRAGMFGEAQARFIISTADVDAVIAIATSRNVPAARIGLVRSERSGFRITMGNRELRADVAELADAYHDAIPNIMSRPALASDAEPERLLAGV